LPSNEVQPDLLAFVNLAIEQKNTPSVAVSTADYDGKVLAISDWTTFIEDAFEHGVLALLALVPKGCTPGFFPQDIEDALNQFVISQRLDNQRRCDDLLILLDALYQEKIPVISFKGPWLSHVAYGDMGLRSFWDLDILIQREHRDVASAILLSQGFVCCTTGLNRRQLDSFWDFCGQDVFQRESDHVVVELHWALTASTLAFDFDYKGLFQRKLSEEWGSKRISHLAPEDELLYLCLHGSKEAWYKIKWLADLAFFIQAHPHLNWPIIWQRAKENGTLRVTALALYILQQLFPAVPVGDLELLKKHTDKQVIRLAKPILNQLLGGTVIPPPDFRLSIYRFRLRERWIDKTGYVWRTCITPRELHFNLIKLPELLFPAYYLVKICHDGLALPIWKLYKHVFKKSGSSSTSNH